MGNMLFLLVSRSLRIFELYVWGEYLVSVRLAWKFLWARLWRVLLAWELAAA